MQKDERFGLGTQRDVTMEHAIKKIIRLLFRLDHVSIQAAVPLRQALYGAIARPPGWL
jgi:hypothetical protein